MSVVTPDQVRALVPTELTDPQLQEVLDREEAWLAGQVGALTGSRVVTHYPTDIPNTRSAVLRLRRTTSSTGMIVTDAGVTLVAGTSYRLEDSRIIRRLLTIWTGPVLVTYTPTDLLLVVAGVIDLCRLTLTNSGSKQESIGAYSSTGLSPAEREAERRTIVQRILGRALPRSVRLEGARAQADELPVP